MIQKHVHNDCRGISLSILNVLDCVQEEKDVMAPVMAPPWLELEHEITYISCLDCYISRGLFLYPPPLFSLIGHILRTSRSL